ncbi:MAG TPA: GNAT family N-acetyltransferase [Methylobacterium sp.]|jgi:RimJ/RimL family protein N-acetyltransferase|uniref:GNAT family N-acetyltransferase n=1 Tax=Methylorubrum sp. B1-46 TaxID=2897334 RepID=UPI001E4DEC8F|nr:GNAT family N-acetyltransferase [Methylorubrum sp. B1-46]UGB25446.1 GNAT family N-acetyltransferase [Methylorubrum sp. B1-46]HEV2543280.1 GNAT family N-acetyltransferase [Methylobacterium sp.]
MFLRRGRPDSLIDLPGLDTARLAIAPLGPEHAPALHRLTDDPAITGAVDFLPTPFTLADAEALIASGRHGRDRFLGAWSREEAAPLIGVVGAHLRGEGAVEIGYWIAGGARGRGFGTEAVLATLDCLRRCFPHRVVVAECRPGNVASWGLLHKVGFRETGADGHRPGRRQLILESA